MSSNQKQELIVPTTSANKYRPYVKIQMLKPNEVWSSGITFNLDTGASWATDVPPSLLRDFGGYVPSSKRKEQPCRIRISGLDGEYEIPVVVQDKDHYDLFEEQSSRKPLCRVRDLTKYFNFIFEKSKTTIRHKSLGIPPETQKAGTIRMPVASPRSGTPTSAWYWSRGTMIGSKTYSNVWFNVNTGDYRFIIPRSYCDKAGLKITSDNISGNGESYATGTFRWDETTPSKLTLEKIRVTARNDNEDFARGGVPRCLMGGVNFLSRYKIVLYDLQICFVPI